MAKEFPMVSIITTFHRVLYINPDLFYRDFSHLRDIDYPNYEILIVSDKKVNISLPNVRFITTGKKLTGPGEKRDIAAKYAKGEILAFIDDDAYPDKSWLKEAVKNFDDSEVGAVGGPGVTPPEDSYLQKIGGLTLQSEFCSGSTKHRFVPAVKCFVKDHPTYNFLVRKNLFLKIGGFHTTLWCGEDTKLCLSIINAGKKIIYEPEAVVYHHRRAFPFGHLEQISNIGLHRGFFVKKYPKTSRELIYFLPSVFVVSVLLSIFIFIYIPIFRNLILIGYFLVFFLYFSTSLFKTNALNSLLVTFSIILTHIVYGIYFIKGLMTNNLTR